MANGVAKIKDINFKQTILQPLEACIDAQAQTTRLAHQHMMTYMFQRRPNGDYAPVEMTFEFSNSEGQHVLHIPLLCLVPITSLQIDDITFSYIATVTHYEKDKMIVNYNRLNLDQSIETERSMKGELQIKLTAEAADMPMGIAQLLELLGNHYPTSNIQEDSNFTPDDDQPQPPVNDDDNDNDDSKKYDVLLKSPGAQKLEIIKKIKELLNIGLKDAKNLIDQAPCSIKENATKTEAEAVKAELVSLGATVELTEHKQADANDDSKKYDILLKSSGPQKLEVIKKIKELLNIGLKDAKDRVDQAPSTIMTGVARDLAETLKAELLALGAEVELR